jgi:hypothetical protein
LLQLLLLLQQQLPALYLCWGHIIIMGGLICAGILQDIWLVLHAAAGSTGSFLHAVLACADGPAVPAVLAVRSCVLGSSRKGARRDLGQLLRCCMQLLLLLHCNIMRVRIWWKFWRCFGAVAAAAEGGLVAVCC